MTNRIITWRMGHAPPLAGAHCRSRARRANDNRIRTFAAVPLSVPVSDGRHAETGFFAAYAGREWLVTAAHLPLLLPRPHARWNEWPPVIQIEGRATGPIVFQLFRWLAGKLDPSFAYLGGGPEPLGDFMAFPVPAGTAHQVDARLFELKGEHAPKIGFQAVIEGYPTATMQTPWPQMQITKLLVKITGYEPAILTYMPAAPLGTSGGPVVGEDGTLWGMTIGNDDGVGKAVTVFAIREILDANLAAARF